MSYKRALEAAGAVIKDFKYFGDYQGTWVAQLEDDTFIVGYYGSCSGCDAFESEFSYCYDDDDESDYNQRLKKFGESYLNSYYTKDEFIKKYLQNEVNDWDLESHSMNDWIKTLI